MQGYVGEKVDISPRVHTMLENMDGIDFLAFVPRGGSGMTLRLAQHLSILGYALVMIAIHGLPQEAAELHVARVRVDALRGAFESSPWTCAGFRMCAAMVGCTRRQWVLSRPSWGRFGPASARIYPAAA